MLSVFFGILGLGTVLCFHFPSLLTMPELRALYPVPWIRALLHLIPLMAFLLGSVSVCLRYNKALGVTGITLSLLAWLLGGSGVSVTGELRNGPFLGLDWLLLNLIGYSAVFVPIERLFALHPQPIFRRQLRVNTLPVPVGASPAQSRAKYSFPCNVFKPSPFFLFGEACNYHPSQ